MVELNLNEAAELEDGPCECEGRGWLEMTSQNSDRRRIQRCDLCEKFATDDDALDAAIAAGWQADHCGGCHLLRCGNCGYCHSCEPAIDSEDACTYGLTLVVNHAE